MNKEYEWRKNKLRLLQVWLTPAQWLALTEAAKAQHISKSELVRESVFAEVLEQEVPEEIPHRVRRRVGPRKISVVVHQTVVRQVIERTFNVIKPKPKPKPPKPPKPERIPKPPKPPVENSWLLVFEQMRAMEREAAADLFMEETQSVVWWPPNFPQWSEFAKVKYLDKKYPRAKRGAVHVEPGSDRREGEGWAAAGGAGERGVPVGDRDQAD